MQMSVIFYTRNCSLLAACGDENEECADVELRL